MVPHASWDSAIIKTCPVHLRPLVTVRAAERLRAAAVCGLLEEIFAGNVPGD